MNILILSCGTRNKIVQYFKNTLTDNDGNRTGNVIATDMSVVAPAIYDADNYYIVPKITDSNYIDIILDICRKEKVSAVMSLIDPELSLLAQNNDRFRQLGVTVVGSSYNACEISLNKMKMYKWLTEHGYKTARSYDDINKFRIALENNIISYPVFVKPISGSASIKISKVYDNETLDVLCSKNDNLMIQEFLDGQEIGADVYVDMISGKVVSIFTKKKISMRAGETDKAVSFKDDRLFILIKCFVEEFGYRGQIDIDIFYLNGEYYISEVNPRFGGGYPHAYESGCNHMKLIVNNLSNITNVDTIGMYDEGIYMMKYNDILIRR